MAGSIIRIGPRRHLGIVALATVLVAATTGLRPAAQAQEATESTLASAVSMSTAGEPATFRYNNRPITELRATVFSRPPAERARVAADLIDSLIRDDIPGPVTTRTLAGTTVLSIGTRDILALFPLDVDPLTGESQESKAQQAAARLQQALDEAVELRTPGRLLRAAGMALAATLLAALIRWQIARLHRTLAVRLPGRRGP